MSVYEVQEVINAIINLKQKTLLIVLYSTGLRLSEMANLKIEDIDSTLMRIKVVNGKGKKDRFVPLSPLVLLQLRQYYIQYKPITYLFNGRAVGKRYAPRTIQKILQNTLAKIGLQHKNYTVHTIRHSFATHLVDNGADLQLIQELMGHHHLSQTTAYLHLSTKRMHQAVNPYDAMLAQMNTNNTTNKNV